MKVFGSILVSLVSLFVVCVTASSCHSTTDGVSGNHQGDQRESTLDWEQPWTLIEGEQFVDVGQYSKITIHDTQVTVSSVLHPYHGKSNLFSSDPDGFWHIDVPQQEPRSWILIDMMDERSVSAIGILARKDVNQLWAGYSAVFEASEDANNWEVVARLGLNSDLLANEWIFFDVPSYLPKRFYRISIHDWKFRSIAELALYADSGTVNTPILDQKPIPILGTRKIDFSSFNSIPIEQSNLTVSSSNEQGQREDQLILPGSSGFWHKRHPSSGGSEWVQMEFTSAQAVSLISILPREGHPDHVWLGYTARLEAKNDSNIWTILAVLGIQQADQTGEWIHFFLGNTQPYKYYRLVIDDKYFLSLARIRLYEFCKG